MTDTATESSRAMQNEGRNAPRPLPPVRDVCEQPRPAIHRALGILGNFRVKAAGVARPCGRGPGGKIRIIRGFTLTLQSSDGDIEKNWDFFIFPQTWPHHAFPAQSKPPPPPPSSQEQGTRPTTKHSFKRHFGKAEGLGVSFFFNAFCFCE